MCSNAGMAECSCWSIPAGKSWELCQTCRSTGEEPKLEHGLAWGHTSSAKPRGEHPVCCLHPCLVQGSVSHLHSPPSWGTPGLFVSLSTIFQHCKEQTWQSLPRVSGVLGSGSSWENCLNNLWGPAACRRKSLVAPGQPRTMALNRANEQHSWSTWDHAGQTPGWTTAQIRLEVLCLRALLVSFHPHWV